MAKAGKKFFAFTKDGDSVDTKSAASGGKKTGAPLFVKKTTTKKKK